MRNAYAAVGAIVGWAALALQVVVILTAAGDASILDRTINLLSLFTILANIMVAVTLTVAALGGGRSRFPGFFALPTVQTGIAVYITITGLGHVLVLRTMTDLHGWAYVADTVLNGVMPLFYVGFWFLFVTKGTLRIGDLVGFLGFPVLYVAYALVRGPIVHWYPYRFVDVGVLGVGAVAVNLLAIGACLALAGLAYIVLDRMIGGPRRSIAVS
ncbi:MAG: Pr6Pr family membrane protein [Bauldia sp.]